MTDEIRRALENRIPASAGAEARQARLRARIAGLEEEKKPVPKRRWPRALAVALVSMLLVGTGLAAGLSLNVFTILSDRARVDDDVRMQQKLDSLRDKNTLVSTSASNVPQGIDLDDIIQIRDAYYDGEVLFVGYVESGLMPTVEWTPTEEELAQFAVPSAIRTKDYKPINQTAETLIEQTLEAGKPFGFKQYIGPGILGRSIQTTDGQRLWYTFGTDSIYNASLDDEYVYSMLQVMSPLPEEIRGKDRIEALLPLLFRPTCYWFDGEELYQWEGEYEQAMLTVVIDRDQDGQRGQYESVKIMLEGTEVTVEADANPYLLHVKLSADEPIFLLTDTSPWHWRIYDDAGRELQKSFMRSYGPTPFRTDIREYSTDGLYMESWLWLYGEIPESFTLEIDRDFYMLDEAGITLRLAE